LGTSLTFTVVYIWSRKNPHAMMNFLGMVNFPAPVMPFVLTLVSVALSGELPISDILGILCGHASLVLEELIPVIHVDDIRIPH
jgi:Derlin-2/3